MRPDAARPRPRAGPAGHAGVKPTGLTRNGGRRGKGGGARARPQARQAPQEPARQQAARRGPRGGYPRRGYLGTAGGTACSAVDPTQVPSTRRFQHGPMKAWSRLQAGRPHGQDPSCLRHQARPPGAPSASTPHPECPGKRRGQPAEATRHAWVLTRGPRSSPREGGGSWTRENPAQGCPGASQRSAPTSSAAQPPTSSA